MTCDIIVIGATISGYIAAIHAARKGYSVVCIAKDIGGFDIKYGYIARKLMSKMLENHEFRMRDIDASSLPSHCHYDMRKLLLRKQYFIRELQANILYLFNKHNIKWMQGDVESISERSLLFTGKYQNKLCKNYEIAFEQAMIMADDPDITHILYEDQAFKSSVITDQVMEKKPQQNMCAMDCKLSANNKMMHEKRFYTPQEALCWNACPVLLLIIGEDCAALELACIWAALGSIVHVINPNDAFLKNFDADMSASIMQKLASHGINISSNKNIEQYVYSSSSDLYHIRFNDGSLGEYNKVISCIKTVNKNYELLEHDDKGLIKVNANYCTSVKNIYAIGTAIYSSHLSHAMSDQAQYVVDYIVSQSIGSIADMAIQNHTSADYGMHLFALTANHHLTPHVLHIMPEMSIVGLSEMQAHAINYAVCRRMFKYKENYGVIKVLYEKSNQKIIGICAIGAGSEMIACHACTAMHHNATLCDIDNICSLSHIKKQAFIDKLSCAKYQNHLLFH